MERDVNQSVVAFIRLFKQTRDVQGECVSVLLNERRMDDG